MDHTPAIMDVLRSVCRMDILHLLPKDQIISYALALGVSTVVAGGGAVAYNRVVARLEGVYQRVEALAKEVRDVPVALGIFLMAIEAEAGDGKLSLDDVKVLAAPLKDEIKDLLNSLE
jgi:hypothetical protein